MEFQGLGGADREIDHTVAPIGTAIVDPHDDRLAVVKIGDPRVARQRHRCMRRRNAVHVVDLAVGGQPAVKIRAVPRCQAFDAVMGIFRGDVGASVDGIRPSHAIDAAALGHRFALLDDARAVFVAARPRAVAERKRAQHERGGLRDRAEADQVALPPHLTPAPVAGLLLLRRCPSTRHNAARSRQDCGQRWQLAPIDD